jgi:hypothetical protein
MAPLHPVVARGYLAGCLLDAVHRAYKSHCTDRAFLLELSCHLQIAFRKVMAEIYDLDSWLRFILSNRGVTWRNTYGYRAYKPPSTYRAFLLALSEAYHLQIAFRKVMAETHGHDLDKWRRSILSKRPSRDYLDGFQMLDLDDRALWDLLKQLMAYQPSKRLSAAGALRHRAFGTGLVSRLNGVLSDVGNVADQVGTSANSSPHAGPLTS